MSIQGTGYGFSGLFHARIFNSYKKKVWVLLVHACNIRIYLYNWEFISKT